MRLQEGGVVWWPHWQLSKPLQHAIHCMPYTSSVACALAMVHPQ